MAAYVGWGVVLKLLTRRLTLREIELIIGRGIPGGARLIRTVYPELSADLDHASDLPIVERILRERQARRDG